MFLQLILSILPLVASINFTPVPIYYITESDITSNPKELYVFNLPLCGGVHIEHFYANVFVNFPDKKWNPVIGDFVKVQVIDIHGHNITSNYVGGQYQFEFKFLYHKEYSDLRLHVTSGNSPALKYTITVTFTNTNHTNTPVPQKRFAKTELERIAWQKVRATMRATMPECNTQEMVTVFKTTGTEVVPTADVIGLSLGYCFDPDQFPGYVYISVHAADEISGFATYACTHEQNCTSTDVAKFFDVTGAAVNFVPVHLTDNKGQIGAINVLVRGDGRDDKNNQFTLGGSKFIHDPPHN